MHRTIIIRREYLHFIPKYARYEKRHSNLAAHVSPAFRVADGDRVTVGQCRPLSKTVGLLIPFTNQRLTHHRSDSMFFEFSLEQERLSSNSTSFKASTAMGMELGWSF
jgi:hypothetical protein